MQDQDQDQILHHLKKIYNGEQAIYILEILREVIDLYNFKLKKLPKSIKSQLDENDVILITYGDQFNSPGYTPLEALNKFLTRYLKDVTPIIHILPFFPYSSDDGFAVINFKEVDEKLGNWGHITEINKSFYLMFDAVINHVSSESSWFQAFIQQESPFDKYFITVDQSIDLSQVVRPRTSPLITPILTTSGKKFVWTTFSSDQVDLNYKNITLFLEICDLLLFYVSRGARFIRLDAIAYLWKELNTPCIHLPQTHNIIKTFRSILDELDTDVYLITETNVQHEDNISYLGEINPRTGITNEAQFVYQFSLGPLVLHSMMANNAQKLTDWAKELDASGSYLNFIASHDGIGLIPAYGILNKWEIQNLVDHTLSKNGFVSYKSNPDESKSVYELNITLFDFLEDEFLSDDINIRRFLSTQAVMLALAGIPGIYIHSLFGSKNCQECVNRSGINRSINRNKFMLEEIEFILNDQNTRTSRIFTKYIDLLRIRRDCPCFNPWSRQLILDIDPRTFAFLRFSLDENKCVFCITNFSSQTVYVEKTFDGMTINKECLNILNGEVYHPSSLILTFALLPYQTAWIMIVG